MHPRTRKMVEQFGISLDGISVMNPVGFLEFLQLESNARLVLTDSGGVQEETCILGRALRHPPGEHRAAGDDRGGGECSGRNGGR
jgi:UDP-N-acetylglucosamine 2-epimerase